jgi:hypothetical protein
VVGPGQDRSAPGHGGGRRGGGKKEAATGAVGSCRSYATSKLRKNLPRCGGTMDNDGDRVACSPNSAMGPALSIYFPP